MTKKDEYEMLMRQADFNINQFNKRREHSWKVTLVFWAALLGTTGILGTLSLPEIPLCAILFGGLILFGLYYKFIYNVFEADKKDKMLAFKARDLAIEKIDEESLSLVRPAYNIDSRNFFGDWSAMFQLIMTFGLTVIAGFILNAI